MNSARPLARGFSLLEVMIVIVIILAILGLVSINLFSARDKAKEDIASAQIQSIKQGLKMFNLAFDRYPTEDEGVAVLWDSETLDDEDSEGGSWRQFMEEAAADPWGSEWGYSDEAEDEDDPYDLWSYGPDKEDGTEDDISVWGASNDEDDFDLGSGPSDGPGD